MQSLTGSRSLTGVRSLGGLAAVVGLAATLGCEMKPDPTRKVTPVEGGFLLVLREGDDAFEHLTRLAIDERVEGATFTAFGFGHATFGYFDQQKKDYDRREFRDVELASLSGSLAWKDGQPSLHAHAVAADSQFNAFGGHLLGFRVGKGSLEIRVAVGPALTRVRDEALGANVLVLPR